MARLDKCIPTFRPRLRAAIPPLLGFSVLHLLVCMLCQIEYIYRIFQKQSALQECRRRCVQLWRKGNKDTCPLRPALMLLPSLPTFVSLLRAWPLLRRQTRDKHEQNCQEDWAENHRVLRGVGARTRRDIAVRGRGECDHGDGKLHDDLAEVVRMPRPRKEAGIADFSLVGKI